MKPFIPVFISCILWGVNDGDTWIGSIPYNDRNIVLNNGNNINITLDRDPNANQTKSNVFGFNGGTSLTLSSTGGSASLTLTKKSDLPNMQFYHTSGNTISINNNANLTISLGSHSNSSNTFLLSGGVIEANKGGKWTLSGAYLLKIGSDGGYLEVNQGGSVEVVWVTEVKVVTDKGKKSGIINNGGDIVLKTEFGIFNSSFNTDPSYQQGSSDSAGVITHNSGTTTIRHREDGKESLLYNAGYAERGVAESKNRHALLEVNGGDFNVVGNLYNGGKMGGSGGAGVGWIVGRGGSINVSNTLYNYSLDSTLPSKIILENATIQTKQLLNNQNGEIYLKDKAHIEATTFTSDANSKVFFIGSGDGFGSISAQTLTLNGEERFRIETLRHKPNLKYLIAVSNNLTGLQEGDIVLEDAYGSLGNRYGAKITIENNQAYLQITPKYSYGSQYTSNSNSIASELDKHFIIPTQEVLDSTTQSILSQIMQLQDLKSLTTYALSNLYNRSAQANITQPKPRLAFNPYTPIYTNTDILPLPLLEEKKSYSVFLNFIGGAFGYKSNLGGNYGANFGIDGFVSENLFLGGYGVILGKTLIQENLKMQGIQGEFGGYLRYLLSSWEFDSTLSYTLFHNSTQREFTLYTQTFSQEASYNTHFFNLEERIGYRFKFGDSDSLKPYAGVGMSVYYQPSFSESGEFTYSQSGIFYGALSVIAGLEYRKIFSSSSMYLGASFAYQLPIFGDTTYTLHFLDSLLYFQNKQDFIAQVQGGIDFTLTPSSFLSLELNYRYSNTQYFDVDGILGYRYIF